MSDAAKIANYCREHLDLENVALGDEYYYQHLPLCIIDTVFGLQFNHVTVVQPLIGRYCNYADLIPFRVDRVTLPEKSEQQSVATFLKLLRSKGTDYCAEHVFDNRRPATARSKKLRSETSAEFAEVLLDHGVDYWQDAHTVINNVSFETDIKRIDGIAEAGVRNFAMLAGDEDSIKPDVWIKRFLMVALGSGVLPANYSFYGPMREAAKELGITARELDHEVWKYMKVNWQDLKR